jgi:predicted SnoaL-like aldol condensation-catalyzing enzyme
MSEMIESKNKALVLEAFDTLFNKRDYAAAERFWSPDYIQHSAHIAPGREGLFDLIKSLPPTLRYEPGRNSVLRRIGLPQIFCAFKTESLSSIGT